MEADSFRARGGTFSASGLAPHIHTQGLTMNKADALSKSNETSPRPETQAECYEGVDLAPSTLESLVTWDVSAHARREQDRLSSAYRTPKEPSDH
jgi:hypothetical protein